MKNIIQGSLANNTHQLKHGSPSQCIKSKINCYNLIHNFDVEHPQIKKW
jgi:hypothetical protein